MRRALNDFKFSTSACWNERYQPFTFDRTEDKIFGRNQLELSYPFPPKTNPFYRLQLNIYPNASEQSMINLGK